MNDATHYEGPPRRKPKFPAIRAPSSRRGLKLLREAIFENLGAAKLFIETVLLLIEGRDDTGARHSLRMGALHFKAAIQSSNELAALKARGGQ